ncbi:MAG: hypothetical protein AAF664_12295 [Planctomycetota bacterium]
MVEFPEQAGVIWLNTPHSGSHDPKGTRPRKKIQKHTEIRERRGNSITMEEPEPKRVATRRTRVPVGQPDDPSRGRGPAQAFFGLSSIERLALTWTNRVRDRLFSQSAIDLFSIYYR